MRLSDLKPGDTGVIVKIQGHGAFRKRVMEMGFVKGREVKCILNAPLLDPIKYELMGYEVSLRRDEASMIEIVPLESWEAEEKIHSHSHTQISDVDEEPGEHYREDHVITVALIGNPNCGKTSLFNMASGAHEHVGNYAGVTVGAKEGYLKYRGYKIKIVDLPGTYSLSAYSPEEEYVLRYLREETPDVIVNVIVASNLERNLYLTTELIDMNRSLVINLNMFDELRKSGSRLDYAKLGQMLGVPIVPTVASTGEGVSNLLDTIIEVYEMRHSDVRHIHVLMRPEIEQAIKVVKDAIKGCHNRISLHFSPRYVAIKLLEGDPEIERMVKKEDDGEEWLRLRDQQVARLKKELGEDVQSAISAEKYGFINGALAETFENNKEHEDKTTKMIDALVTSKLFGFPIFLAIMLFMFWCTFKIGSYPMEWIESGVDWLSSFIGERMTDGPLKDMLLNGIIGGVGGVIVFLPNILILYFFISFMEDSGYMARVAFIMDKIMHRMGLHGKSFIPLVMGFGCNVPAIMSSRIIESKSSRLITVLITPFMSCSARIPIYVLLVGAFFPHNGTFVFFGLYLLGIVIAVATARLLRRFWFKVDETPFVMELPPYRVPTAKATARAMWNKAQQYLKKMGGLILVASIIIWALSYYPRVSADQVPQDFKQKAIAEMPPSTLEEIESDPAQIDEMVLNEYQQEHSILGRIGKVAEPIMRPLDMGWKQIVSLIAGSAAKEVVVSTMGVLYVGDDNEGMLSKRLQTPSPLTGKAPFTKVSAIAFMIFVLVYFPCIATITAISRETGSWKYGLFSVVYNSTLAWLLAWIATLIGSLF